MKTIVPLLAIMAAVALSPSLHAKEENGIRLEIRKTILEKNDGTTGGWNDRVDRTLGLKVEAKNTSMKEMPAGTIEWIMIVEKYGYSTDRLQRYQGTEPFPSLKSGQEIDFNVGESKIEGWRSAGDSYQDKIEGWRVIIKHEGKPTITIESSSTFSKMNAKAKDAPKE